MGLLHEIWAIKQSKKYTDRKIGELGTGVKLKGSVDYYSDLPSEPEAGDAYIVKYLGTSGTAQDGTVYAWTENDGWIPVNKKATVQNEILYL